MRAWRGLALGAAVVLAAASTAARADDDFFKGKDITLYSGSPPGGPYDTYTRLIGRHFGAHIPGHPNVVVQNMVGASGRRMIGYLYNLAPRDGTAIGAAERAVALAPLLGEDTQFDALKMAWLGSANTETNVCIVWHTSAIKTIDDVKTHDMNVGTSGPSSTDAIYPHLMNALFGMRFKVIGGYKGAPQSDLAMERGELDGRCGISWDTLVALKPTWLDQKLIRLLVQIALDRDPHLPDVPWVFDMAKTDEQRQILTFWTLPNKMGRPFVAPQGLPPDRIALLRNAFAATLADPELRAEAAAMKLAVNGVGGEEVMALIAKAYAMPKAILEKAAQAASGQ
jgi:tripartite-type tricarboxylate transporter receptor subunit TctC